MSASTELQVITKILVSSYGQAPIHIVDQIQAIMSDQKLYFCFRGYREVVRILWTDLFHRESAYETAFVIYNSLNKAHHIDPRHSLNIFNGLDS